MTLVIYIGIYKRSFGAIGKARKLVAGDRRQEWFLWCLGSALFATVVASFGIYFIVYLMVCLFCFGGCFCGNLRGNAGQDGSSCQPAVGIRSQCGGGLSAAQ